ncbi:uncharacterized protein LOC130231083 [Danio aesculapii]|uniref:uncharacterized protein LOC130231083 n=1 Tax=Danio aesculapii TaxID=1142201 RepID=UPI0024BFF86C|nr:uncharacterized protein LOC130231083 [Danio aesculapii]
MATMLNDQNNTQPVPQLLSVGEKEKKRLLEVYVKRSLSLNDGTQCTPRKEHRSHKWVPIVEQKTRVRRHSSDTSLNLTSKASISDEDIRFDSIAETPLDKKDMPSGKKSKKRGVKESLRRNDGSNASQKSNGKSKKWFQRLDKGKEEGGQISDALPTQTSTFTAGDNNAKMLENVEQITVEKKDKKAKKSTVWKSFLSWFTKENTEKEQEHQRTEEDVPLSKPSSPQISCLPLADVLSKTDNNVRRSKSLKKKKSFKWRRSGDMSAAKSVEMVEHSNSYYEKMSEELEKIVHEVKDSPTDDNPTSPPTSQNACAEVSQEEVIRRIIELIKQQGDKINDTLKENPSVCAYLDSGFSYRSFQQMADQYVQSEVPNKNTRQSVVAPELVKFAFTLDFTARVANLHSQSTGQIMGFGNQYLQDRFTHMSESHPHLADVKAGDRRTLNLE